MIKKSLLIMGAILAGVSAWVGVSTAQSFFRLDLVGNPIIQYMRSADDRGKFGERIQLFETYFKAAEERAAVVDALEAAGFKRTPDAKVWARYQFEVANKREVYQREANQFPCNIQVYVFVEFDAEDRLIFAEDTDHEHGCL